MRLIEELFIVCMFCLIVLTEFSPFLISLFTGNWWFMLLFSVSWIPAFLELMFTAVMLN